MNPMAVAVRSDDLLSRTDASRDLVDIHPKARPAERFDAMPCSQAIAPDSECFGRSGDVRLRPPLSARTKASAISRRAHASKGRSGDCNHRQRFSQAMTLQFGMRKNPGSFESDFDILQRIPRLLGSFRLFGNSVFDAALGNSRVDLEAPADELRTIFVEWKNLVNAVGRLERIIPATLFECRRGVDGPESSTRYAATCDRVGTRAQTADNSAAGFAANPRRHTHRTSLYFRIRIFVSICRRPDRYERFSF
jgi:hypothetical protein